MNVDPITSRESDTTDRPPVNRIRIADKWISSDAGVFVIAEAGVNHDGSLEKAIKLVDAVEEAGADAVKFQVFEASRLTTACVGTVGYQTNTTGATSQRDLLAQLELSTTAFRSIAAHCRSRGIIFLATPFSVEDVERVVALGSPAIKIASTDIIDGGLLGAATATGRPLILSTGASDQSEVASATKAIHRQGGDRLVLLHCVSQYPTPFDSANLAAIGSLRARFGVPVGYSDHTVESDTGALAVAAGACVLEKHVTLDRQSNGPDHAMSLTPDDLATYIALARRARSAMGDGRIECTTPECEVRRLARKSLVAACDIPAGVSIRPEYLTSKRAGSGLTAEHHDNIIGRRARLNITADTPIALEMVD